MNSSFLFSFVTMHTWKVLIPDKMGFTPITRATLNAAFANSSQVPSPSYNCACIENLLATEKAHLVLSSWELSPSDNIQKLWQTTRHGKISVVCLALDSGVPCAFSVLFLLFYWNYPEKKNGNNKICMTKTDRWEIANMRIPAFFFDNFRRQQ